MRITRLILFFISTMLLYLIAMLGLGFSYAYTKGWILTDFESIEAKQAIVLLAHDKNITLLDVRTPKEYEEGHLKNAKHIPVQILTQNLSMLKGDKNQHILVYCRSGNRSIKASRILEENGFTPINIKGGYFQLLRDGIEAERGSPFLKP